MIRRFSEGESNRRLQSELVVINSTLWMRGSDLSRLSTSCVAGQVILAMSQSDLSECQLAVNLE